MYLQCFIFDSPRLWVLYLPWAELWYNTSFQSAIGMSPFKVVYRRDPPFILHFTPANGTPPDLQTQLRNCDALLARLKLNLEKAQRQMKKYANSKWTELTFDVGDYVFVKLKLYRQHSVNLQCHQKLGLRFFGPFEIVQKLGPVAYKLKLPPEARIHLVFHVSLLRRCFSNLAYQYVPLPLLIMEEGFIVHPCSILDVRFVQTRMGWQNQLLVQWDGLVAPSWESVDHIQNSYPQFALEDKVALDGEGNVTMRQSQADVAVKEVNRNAELATIT